MFFFFNLFFFCFPFLRNGKMDDVVLGYDNLEGEMEIVNLFN